MLRSTGSAASSIMVAGSTGLDSGTNIAMSFSISQHIDSSLDMFSTKQVPRASA